MQYCVPGFGEVNASSILSCTWLVVLSCTDSKESTHDCNPDGCFSGTCHLAFRFLRTHDQGTHLDRKVGRYVRIDLFHGTNLLWFISLIAAEDRSRCSTVYLLIAILT